MANFYYQSEGLGRVLYLADVESLSAFDLKILQEELSVAVEDIGTQMYEQRDTADFDKIHSMSHKIQVCKKFMIRITQVQQGESLKVKSYHLSFFRQAVSALVGPLEADKLYEKAKQNAFQQAAKEAKS